VLLADLAQVELAVVLHAVGENVTASVIPPSGSSWAGTLLQALSQARTARNQALAMPLVDLYGHGKKPAAEPLLSEGQDGEKH
jgi:hypothetical protein